MKSKLKLSRKFSSNQSESSSFHDQQCYSSTLTVKRLSSSKYNPAQIQHILQELQHSASYAFFEKYQRKMEEMCECMLQEIIKLELKVARCQRHLNSVELDLVKKCRENAGIRLENQELIRMNEEVEQHLKKLKDEYDKTIKHQEVEGARASVNELRKSIDRLGQPEERENLMLTEVKTLIEEIQENLKPEEKSIHDVMDVVGRIIELCFAKVEMEEGLSDFVQAKIL